MLYLIGIGLCDEKDLTLRALEIIQQCESVYLEDYTSFSLLQKEKLEALCKHAIQFADRNFVENRSLQIVNDAKKKNICILVVGDPLSATTHSALLLEAKQHNVAVEVIHNASILTAVGETGLQLYKFGRVSSLSFHASDVPYEILEKNLNAGLHTLFLLDRDEHHRALTVGKGARMLLELETTHDKKIISPLTKVFVCSRMGTSFQSIRVLSLENASKTDFGKPPHCIIVWGTLHFLEEEWIKEWEKSEMEKEKMH